MLFYFVTFDFIDCIIRFSQGTLARTSLFVAMAALWSIVQALCILTKSGVYIGYKDWELFGYGHVGFSRD